MTQLFLSHSKQLKQNIVIPFSNDLSLLNFPYWFDRNVISSGNDIYAHIIEGIKISSHCVAFIDDAYLHREWTLKELELFRDKEIQTQSTLILPIYCGIQKETVYKTVPWLKDRAFERIEGDTYEICECERIVCRIINRLLDEIEVAADISVLEQHMYILFAGLMGLRKSEILGLKYSDVDFTRQTLYVQRQLGKDLSKPQDELPKKTLTKQEVSLKTRSSKRVLDIPDVVFNAILEQRRIYEKNRRRRPGQFQDEGYICCSSYGRPQSASYCYKGYKKLLSDNGLPNIRFHDLRHTYATILTNEEIDVKAISNSLGHSKTIITVDVYTDKKQMIVDVSEQTQEFACEIFPITYLQEQRVEEANRTRFLDEIYYFPEGLAEEIMGIIK